MGPLGEAQPGRDAVRAVAAMLGSEGDELARVLDEAMRRHPEAFVLSLVQLAAALALSSPEDAAVPGSLAWWALRHEVVLARGRSS